MGKTIGTIFKIALIVVAIVISVIAMQPQFTLTLLGKLVVVAGFYAASSMLNAQPEAGVEEQKGLQEEIQSTVVPRQVLYGTTRIAGTRIYAGTSGTDNKYLTMIYVVSADEITSFDKWFLDDDEVTLNGSGVVTTGQFANKVRILPHLGSATQVADTTLVSELSDWTSNHKLQGLAYYSVRYEFDPEVFTGSRPKVTTVASGVALYNPALDSTVTGGSGTHRDNDPATWAFSNDWSLVALDYMKRSPLGARIPIEWISLPQIIASYNVSDEDVTLDIGGTQKRYTADGIISSLKKRNANIDGLLRAAMGTLIYQSGLYYLYPGAGGTATITFDESDLRGPVSLRTKKPVKDLVNRAVGSFVDETDDLYQETDYPEYIDTTAETTDGEVLELALGQPYLQNGSRAQRVGKMFIEQNRLQQGVAYPVKKKGLQVQAWSIIKVNSTRWSWVDKLFRVTQWQRQPNGGVDLTLQEYDADAYAWDETLDESPILVSVPPTLDNGTTVPTPTGLAAVAFALVSDSGASSAAALDVSWTAPTIGVSAIVVSYKITSETELVALPPLVPTKTGIVIPNLNPDTSYTIYVGYKNLRGVTGTEANVVQTTGSDYAVDYAQVAGDTAPDDYASNVGVIDHGGSLILNSDMTVVASDGRPAGVYGAHGGTGGADILYNDAGKTILQIGRASPEDTSTGAMFPAFPVIEGRTYKFSIRAKATATSATGFYIYALFHNADLAEGITHIVSSTTFETGAPAIDANMANDTQRSNGGITTSYVVYEYEVEVPAGAIWGGIGILNWSGMGNALLLIDKIVITPQNVDTEAITDDATTQGLSVNAADATTVDSLTEKTIATLAVTTKGHKLHIIYSGHLDPSAWSGAFGCYVRLYRDTTKLREIILSGLVNTERPVTITYAETPSAGAYTYYVKVQTTGIGPPTVTSKLTNVLLLELKR